MPIPRSRRIADIVRVQARLRPDAAALVVGERTIIVRGARRAVQPSRPGIQGGGHRLWRPRGVHRQERTRVFRCVVRSCQTWRGLRAVNWRLAPPEMLQIIEDAKAPVVVVGSEFFRHIEAIETNSRGSTPLSRSAITTTGTSSPTGLPPIPMRIPVSSPARMTSRFSCTRRAQPDCPRASCCPTTTVRLGERCQQWRFDADSVSLAAMPLFHIAGAGWAVVGLYMAAIDVLCATSTPKRSWIRIASTRSLTCCWFRQSSRRY